MIRLDDHLTAEETAARLAEVDRLTAPLHRRVRWRWWLTRAGVALLGAFLGVLAVVVL